MPIMDGVSLIVSYVFICRSALLDATSSIFAVLSITEMQSSSLHGNMLQRMC
jgi:hypothetical protein